jgi:hypothetical protein
MIRRLAVGAFFASALITAGAALALPASAGAASDGPVAIGQAAPAPNAVAIGISARAPAADDVVDIGISARPPAWLADEFAGSDIQVLPQAPSGGAATPFPATGAGVAVVVGIAGALVVGGALLLASGRRVAL